jgi:lipopolysaccharide export LptBFGC system permease protein LptF
VAAAADHRFDRRLAAVEAPVIPTLDRHLAVHFARNLALVACAVVVVFMALDVLLSFHLLAKQGTGPWLKLELFAARVPALLNFAIPVAAIIAVLATAAPMLRRGEFTALGGAGIGLRRSTRALLVGCLLAGIIDAVIADAAAPPATAHAMALQDELEGQSREGRVWRTDDGTTWFAGGARLVATPEPRLARVVVATRDSLLLADRLVWNGTAWMAPMGCAVMTVRDGAQRLDRLPAGQLPAAARLDLSPPDLYRRLLPRHTMSGAELLDRGERADMAMFWARWTRILLPVLAGMAALAVFVRFSNRDRVVVATVEASLAALVPVAILTISGIAADTAPGPAGLGVAIGVVLAAALPLTLWLRWRL